MMVPAWANLAPVIWMTVPILAVLVGAVLVGAVLVGAVRVGAVRVLAVPVPAVPVPAVLAPAIQTTVTTLPVPTSVRVTVPDMAAVAAALAWAALAAIPDHTMVSLAMTARH